MRRKPKRSRPDERSIRWKTLDRATNAVKALAFRAGSIRSATFACPLKGSPTGRLGKNFCAKLIIFRPFLAAATS